MSELYNAEYYKQYDVGCGKVDYSDSEYTKRIFNSNRTENCR